MKDLAYNNFGLGGQYENDYDEFLGLGKKAKARKAEKRKFRSDKRGLKIEKRKAKVEKIKSKVEGTRADTEDIKAQTAFTQTMAQPSIAPQLESPGAKQAGGGTMMTIVVVGLVVTMIVGAVVTKKKIAPLGMAA